MAVVYLSPIGNSVIPFLNATGAPNASGFLSTFLAGTSTPSATYTTSAGSVNNAVSIPLGADGRVPNEIWLVSGISYKFVLLDSTSTLIPGSTYDNISGINDPAALNFIAQTLITAKGNLIVGTANATAAILTVGANGTVPMARSQATSGLAYVSALGKSIYGFTYANNGTDSIDIAAGGAMDATNAYWINVIALTKQSNVPWASGTNVGGLDTGAVGNSDYYIWAIARSDTGVTDYLFSLSSTAPTMPASYDFKRLIGWFKRVVGVVVAFHTYETEGGGLELNWDVPTLDVAVANPTMSADRIDPVKVPQNFSTIAHLNVFMSDAAVANIIAWIRCPDQIGAQPGNAAAPLLNFFTGAAATLGGLQMRIRTSATGTIAARANINTIDNYDVSTMGLTWARRN